MARTIIYEALNTGAALRKPTGLESIPAEVREELEKVYEGLKANPNGRMKITFDTVGELNEYVVWAKSYCEVRPAGKLRYRKSPVKDAPANVLHFRIFDIPVEAEAATQAVRDAAQAVSDAAKKEIEDALKAEEPATVTPKKTTVRR